MSKINEKIKNYLEEYLESLKFKNCTSASIRAYKYDLNNIFNQIAPDKRIEDISLPDLRKAIVHVCKDCAAITIRRRISAVKSFYKFMVNNDYLIKDIAGRIEIPKIKQETLDILTLEEIKKVINYYSLHYNPMIDKLKPEQEKDILKYKKRLFKWSLLIHILFNTMARISEVIKMQYRDIKVDSQNLILHGKGQKDRIIPLPDCIEVLDHSDKNEYIFSREDGKPYKSPRYLQKKIQDIGTELGIEKLSPHKFRRTSGSFARQNGLEIEILSELMGHASSSTTISYYLKTNKESLKDFKEKIKNIF